MTGIGCDDTICGAALRDIDDPIAATRDRCPDHAVSATGADVSLTDRADRKRRPMTAMTEGRA